MAAALYARDGELGVRHRTLALARLGELLASLRRATAAEATYREALALAESRRDARLVARLNNHLGTLLLRSGRVDEAGFAFEQAVDGERRGGDVLDLAAALNNLGQSQERSGQAALARRSYADALAAIAAAGEEGTGLAAILRAHLERLDASRGPAARPLSLGA
ncbi:MAG: tetratricopeptide repeat protein [Piscinibacter sp.]